MVGQVDIVAGSLHSLLWIVNITRRVRTAWHSRSVSVLPLLSGSEKEKKRKRKCNPNPKEGPSVQRNVQSITLHWLWPVFFEKKV